MSRGTRAPMVRMLFPSPSKVAIGGYVIALRYADALSERGWGIEAEFPLGAEPPAGSLDLLRRIYWRLLLLRRDPLEWYAGSRRFRTVVTLWPRRLGDSRGIDVGVGAQATGMLLNIGSARAPIHFVQGYEDWSHADETLERLFRESSQRVVTSQALARRMERLGLDATIVANPTEPDHFHVERHLRERQNPSVGFMVHLQPLKSWKTALEAVQRMESMHPGLVVRAFGTAERPSELPSHFEYVRNPSREELRRIFNDVRVFLAPSLSEGWGLTPAEAMQCGCAVVASDIDGHREFLEDGRSGRLVPPGDAGAMAEAASSLLADPAALEELARGGLESIRRFTLADAIDRWEEVLRRGLG